MIVIPEVELHEELREPGSAGPDPAMDLLRGWRQHGFTRVHLRAGRCGVRAAANFFGALSQEVAVQWQPGSCSADDAAEALDNGAVWVVVCANVTTDEDWVLEFSHTFPQRVIVAADVLERILVPRPWKRRPVRRLLDLVSEWSDAELAAIMVTGVDQRGRVQPADARLLEDVVETAALPVFARASVTAIRDIQVLADCGVQGIVMHADLSNGALTEQLLAEQEWD